MGLAADIRVWTKEHFAHKCISQPPRNNEPDKLYLVIEGGQIKFCAWLDLDTLNNPNGCEFIEIPGMDSDDLFTSEFSDCMDKARHEWSANVRHFFATRLDDEITKRNEATLQAAKELAEQQHYMGFDIDSVIDMLDGEYSIDDSELDSIYAHLESL